jgi:anti-sigma factor RsiW
VNTCPEQIELYAFVDGELPRQRWLVIDEHLPRCSRCRDEIRGIARLNRCLHAQETPDLPDDFEQSFRTALLSRTITSNEVRTFRQVVETKRLVYLAAGFILALLTWQLATSFDSTDVSNDDHEIATGVESVQKKKIAQLSFDRLLAVVIASHSKADDTQVREVQGRFAKNGESLVGHISKRFDGSTMAEEMALYAILAETKSRQAQSLLARRLRRQPPRSPMRLAILDAVIKFPNEETARLIGRESQSGLPLDKSFDLLRQLPSQYYWPELSALCRRHIKVAPKEVVDLLASMEDERAESFLLDLHLGGMQSSGLTAHLVQRTKVIERSRAIISTGETSVSHKRLAMKLLAEKGDIVSEGILANLVDDPQLGNDAILALARVGTEDAMVKVVHRLSLASEHYESSADRKKRAQIEAAIQGMGTDGLDLVTRLVHIENHRFRAHYVRALGILGDEETLPLIYTFAEVADLKESALRAVLRIGSASSSDFLKKMSRDQNQEIRRLAKRGLKKLRLAPMPRKWRGFANLRAGSCGNSPRMV